MSVIITQLKRSKFLRYGAPFIVLVVGGSFVLKNFGQVRYKYSNTAVSPQELSALNKAKARQDVTLEEEYEKVKNMDIDNWEQVRGPRPWEEQPHEPDNSNTEKAKPET